MTCLHGVNMQWWSGSWKTMKISHVDREGETHSGNCSPLPMQHLWCSLCLHSIILYISWHHFWGCFFLSIILLSSWPCLRWALQGSCFLWTKMLPEPTSCWSMQSQLPVKHPQPALLFRNRFLSLKILVWLKKICFCALLITLSLNLAAAD